MAEVGAHFVLSARRISNRGTPEGSFLLPLAARGIGFRVVHRNVSAVTGGGMPNTAFADIGACVFDAYGTLFDVHSAVGHRGGALVTDSDRMRLMPARFLLNCLQPGFSDY